MEKKLIGFTTSDGKKHLGFYTPVTNPCGEHWEEESFVELYTSVSGKEYRNVIEKFHVNPIKCYYWDEEKGSKELLPAPALPKPSTSAETLANFYRFFSKDYQDSLITDDKGSRIALLKMIQEWLILNTKGAKGGYVDKEFVIHSEEKIQVNSDVASSIPEYIRIEQ